METQNMAQLVYNPGGAKEQAFPLWEGSQTVGRHQDNDIVIDDASLSKRHAMLEVVGGQVTLIDLQSKNGTCVAGCRIGRVEPRVAAKGRT